MVLVIHILLHAVCAVDAVANRGSHDGDGDNDDGDIVAKSSHSYPHSQQQAVNLSNSSLGLYHHYDPLAVTRSRGHNPLAASVCKTHRASTWCCGDFVLRTLTKAHLE